MRDDDMLYVKLGLDLSEFMRGFEDARKIAAENMAQLKKDIDSVARELSAWNNGLIAAGHWTEEDLKRQDAEQRKKFEETPIKLDEEELELYEKKLRDIERAEKRIMMNRRDEDIARYALEHDGADLEKYELKRMRDYKLDVLDARMLKLQEELEKTTKKELREAIEGQLKAIEDEQLVIDKNTTAKLEQIEKEHRDKIAEAIQTNFDNAADIEYEMTHSAYEKQIRDIERWEEAQKEKAETAEEISAIIAESAAKEAQAFEDEMDRIKGTLQSLEDKIFEQEHSQYENDLRRAQQERLKLYEDFQSKGILNADTQAMIERYFQNAVGKLNRRADESRTKGGDYTKTPEGVMHGGGNGIVVIGADQIVDNGLISAQSREISLLTDENQIRAQLATKLDAAAKAEVEKIEAARALTDAQKDFIQLTQQASGFSLIEGDKFTSQPAETQIISGDQNIPVPAEELRQFSEALQQADPLQDLKESAQSAADVQKEFAEKVRDFPPDYFKQLADGTASLGSVRWIV